MRNWVLGSTVVWSVKYSWLIDYCALFAGITKGNMMLIKSITERSMIVCGVKINHKRKSDFFKGCELFHCLFSAPNNQENSMT